MIITAVTDREEDHTTLLVGLSLRVDSAPLRIGELSHGRQGPVLLRGGELAVLPVALGGSGAAGFASQPLAPSRLCAAVVMSGQSGGPCMRRLALCVLCPVLTTLRRPWEGTWGEA